MERPGLLFPKLKCPKEGEYLGLHRFGKRVVFEYQIGDTKIQDEPWAGENSFYRRIDFLNPVTKLSLPCKVMDGAIKVEVVESNGIEKAEWKQGELIFQNASQELG